MEKEKAASVQIIVSDNGVERVRLCGNSWDDEECAMRIYRRISHLIKEIEKSVQDPSKGGNDVK
jgi:hypothetical protein